MSSSTSSQAPRQNKGSKKATEKDKDDLDDFIVPDEEVDPESESDDISSEDGELGSEEEDGGDEPAYRWYFSLQSAGGRTCASSILCHSCWRRPMKRQPSTYA